MIPRDRGMFHGELPPDPNAKLVIMYTIFNAPTDFPNHFVMRRSRVYPGQVIPEYTAGLYTSLEEAREDIPPSCINLGRHTQDVPSIVETWI